MDSKMTAPADTDALVALHDAAWDAIICDEELREFRKKCSIHEIRQVVRACVATLTAAQQWVDPYSRKPAPIDNGCVPVTAQQSGAPCCGKFSECSQPCSPRADYWQEKATLCDEFAAQQKAQEDGWPLLFARFIARTKSVIKSDRMIPHDEGTRLSWIETKNGQGICDITNEEYFAILDLMRSPLPPLPKESEK